MQKKTVGMLVKVDNVEDPVEIAPRNSRRILCCPLGKCSGDSVMSTKMERGQKQFGHQFMPTNDSRCTG